MTARMPGILRVAFNPSLMVLRQLNCHVAALTKIHRTTYERMYPTLLVQPDGSSIIIKYHEPRQIIRLPVNLATLSEAERKARLLARRPRTAIKIEDEIEDEFDAKRYLKYIKK